MNTVLKLQVDDSSSFESRITRHLMKDCYDRLINELGSSEAHGKMMEAWYLIEQEMTESGLTEPVLAAAILFEKSNYNKQLHTLYYASIFWKESVFAESINP